MEHKKPYLSPFSSPFLLLVFFLLEVVGVFLLAGFSVSTSASTFISDDVFEDRASFGRNLLQAKHPCPMSFEFLNYTIITSQCKGPLYLPNLCCGAFKEFACPYADDLNDLTNDCASSMFSYINLYGNTHLAFSPVSARMVNKGLSAMELQRRLPPAEVRSYLFLPHC